MIYYELATLSTVIFGAGKASDGIQAYLNAPEAKGKLLGAWFSDIGQLNEVYILRGFDSLEDMMAERERMYRSENPFGCIEHLTALSAESFRALDFLPPVEPGEFGPCYEIRTYKMKLNGLMPTMGKWEETIPKRNDYSPLTIAMYGLDGEPRLTQIWPYPSLEARSKARAQSVADGNWPPKGGPDWLSPDMTSTVALPLPFSPLK
jgi:hypothetical protein